MAINYKTWRPFDTPELRRDRRVEKLKKQATRLAGAYMYGIGITEWSTQSIGWTTFDDIALPNGIRFTGSNSEKDRFIYELQGGLETLHEYISDNWKYG